MKTNHETQLDKHFQPLPSADHNLSEIFCVILFTKHAFKHLNLNFIIPRRQINVHNTSTLYSNTMDVIS